MVKKYSCYNYEIICKEKGTDNAQYDYIIYLTPSYVGGDECIESDAWYDTEQEAEAAAMEHIDMLEDGHDEPDYDTQNYFKQGPEYWAERRKLGE